MTERAKFRKYVGGLRRLCPPTKPVKVDTRRMPDAARWRDEGKRFRITIAAGTPYQMKLECLCHEWAHCLDPSSEECDPHNAVWGVFYARCYRAMNELMHVLN